MRNFQVRTVVVAALTATTASITSAETIIVNAGQSIQAAIDVAGNGDIVQVEPGVYNEALSIVGKAIEVRSRTGPVNTILDGTALGDSIVSLTGVGRDTVLRGFTLTTGAGRLDNEGDTYGGGVYTTGDPTIRQCIFLLNTARFGGGMYVAFGNPLVSECVFDQNFAPRQGGGLMIEASEPVSTTGDDDSETFTATTVQDCAFSGNFSQIGGGLRLLDSSAIVTRCTFIANTSQGGPGGGVAVERGTTPAIDDCLFADNFTLYTWAGALHCFKTTISVTNCTFTGNGASEIGSTIVSQRSFTYLDNCIVWANGPEPLLSISTGGLFFTNSDLQVPMSGPGNIVADPMFVNPLGGDYRLMAGSPCIDAGNSLAAIARAISTDVVRADRFAGAAVDMGAYEFDSFRRVLDGVDSGDAFGSSVTGLGDVDGDMVPDYAVGSPASGNGRGSMEVFSGTSGRRLWRRNGSQPGEQFGFAVSGAGDLNADGVPDVVVGGPFYDPPNATVNTGRVYAYSGIDGAVIFMRRGAFDSGRFGWSIAAGVDVNNDGIGDIVVGAPFAGLAGGLSGAVDVISGADASVLCRRSGQSAGDQYGWSVTGLGQADGVAGDDFAVGAPFNDQNGNDAGKLYVYSGGAAVSMIFVAVGQGPTDTFGWSVAGGGDFDGDGLNDLVVGAPGRPAGGSANSGRVYAYKGSQRTVLWIMGGPLGSRFGEMVAIPGDLDGDGTVDALGGGPSFDSILGADVGVVRRFSGTTGAVLGARAGQAAGARYGTSAAQLGQMNSDMKVEYIIGSPGAAEGRTEIESAP